MSAEIRREIHIDINDLTRRLTQLTRVKVGFPADKREADGTSSAGVAAVHEFGDPARRIPERPFLRPAILENLPRYRAFNRDRLHRILHGEMTARMALEQLGAMAVGLVQKKLRDGPFAPLSPRTIRARMSRRSAGYRAALARRGPPESIDKPLIDTGFMRQNVTYVVEED